MLGTDLIVPARPGNNQKYRGNHKKEYLLKNLRELIRKVFFGLDGQNGMDVPDRHSMNLRNFVLSRKDEN